MFSAGYIGLFLSAFISATIFPMASEAFFTTMLVRGYDVVWCIAIATIGNSLGSLTTYGLGRLGNLATIERWLRIKPEKALRYEHYAHRYGFWLGLLIWLPIVGDVLAVCMGLAKTSFFLSATMIFIGKFARYLIIAVFTLKIIT